MGNHLGHELRFDDLTKSVVTKPLEVVANKYGSHELTLFLNDRRTRLIQNIQEKGTIEDVKEMEKYMTKREIDMAFGDLGKYAKDLNSVESQHAPINTIAANKFF